MMYYLSRQAAAMRPAGEVILPCGVYELDVGSVFQDAYAIQVFDPFHTEPAPCSEPKNVRKFIF